MMEHEEGSPSMVAQNAHDVIAPDFSFNHLNFRGDPALLKEIFALRYEVYCLECGFLSPEEFQNGLETDEYDATSAHFTAKNAQDELVGSLRLVLPDVSQAFPFQQHCDVLFENFVMPPRSECGEISRLVVRKTYRRRPGDNLAGVSRDLIESNVGIEPIQQSAVRERRSRNPQILLGLYREMYRYSVHNGIRYWYAAMERSLARALSSFNFVFTPIGLQTDYYGPVIPYIADLRELEARVSKASPELYAWIRGELGV